MADKFQFKNAELHSPGEVFYAITPSDTVDIPLKPRAVVLGVGGNLNVTDALGTTTLISNLTAGIFYPIRPVRIMATGTTASNIVGVC